MVPAPRPILYIKIQGSSPSAFMPFHANAIVDLNKEGAMLALFDVGKANQQTDCLGLTRTSNKKHLSATNVLSQGPYVKVHGGRGGTTADGCARHECKSHGRSPINGSNEQSPARYGRDSRSYREPS